jgi:hypothetical protein
MCPRLTSERFLLLLAGRAGCWTPSWEDYYVPALPVCFAVLLLRLVVVLQRGTQKERYNV